MWSLPWVRSPTQVAELSRLPAGLAQAQLNRQLRIHRSVSRLWQRPDSAGAGQLIGALRDWVAGLLALPFDALRVTHAAAVIAGAWPRSLLESSRFEQRLGRIEKLSLGPLARRA